MSMYLLTTLAAPLLLQSAPDAGSAADAASEPLPKVTSIDQMPIEQSASIRCGLAFAVVSRWQNQDDSRGEAYPDMTAEGGREFFVRSLVPLMEDRAMTRVEVQSLIMREARELEQVDDGGQVQAMMPACLLMKRSSGL